MADSWPLMNPRPGASAHSPPSNQMLRVVLPLEALPPAPIEMNHVS